MKVITKLNLEKLSSFKRYLNFNKSLGHNKQINCLKFISDKYLLSASDS